MKRRLADSSDDDNSREVDGGMAKQMRESPVANNSSEIKCPCCGDFMSPKSFSDHACFRNICSQSIPKDLPGIFPIPSSTTPNSGDLDILFSIFKGSTEFRDSLLKELKSVFYDNQTAFANNFQNLIALAIELYCQEDENFVFNGMDVERLFNFKELKNLQKATTSNQCTICKPLRNFVLPGNKGLHSVLHHGSPIPGGSMIGISVKTLLNCIDNAIKNCSDTGLFNGSFNTDTNSTVLMLQKLFEKSSNLENYMNLFFPKNNAMFNWNSIFSTMSNQANKSIPNNQIQPEVVVPEPNLTNNSSNINSKRGRTRLTSQQLSILRSYFDINNSPTEEKILEICSKTGLQEKVVKHWFRNTLFKERQRNKDNPYNFSIPPSTSLNLEEYEKTGKIEVKPTSHLDRVNSSSDSSSKLKQESSDLSQEINLDGNESSESYDGSFCSDRKRYKVELTTEQMNDLIKYHKLNPNPSKFIIENIARDMNLPKKYIQNWFNTSNGNDVKSNTSQSIINNQKDLDSFKMSSKTGDWSNALGMFIGKCPHCPFNVDPLMHRIQPNLLQCHINSQHSLDKRKFSQNFNEITNITDILTKKSAFLNCGNSDERPLDLSSQNLLPQPSMIIPFGIPPQIQTEFVQSNLHAATKDNAESTDDDSGNGVMYTSEKNGQNSGGQQVSNSQSQQSRRNRTSISNFQSKCMFAIYEYHKTPSVQECDRLGDYIGLTRRVVQVWFQNQRAKEKKMARVSNTMQSKLNPSQTSVNNPPLNLCTNNACLLCGIAINTNNDEQAIQRSAGTKCDRRLIEHLFTSGHLEKLTNLYSKELKISSSNNGSSASMELEIM